MTPGRIALLALACVSSGALTAGYIFDAGAEDHVMPHPLAMFLWLCSIVAWNGFIGAHICAALVEHMDVRLVKLLAAIRGLDGEADSKRIDDLLAAQRDMDIPPPTQRRPRPHSVALVDRRGN